MRQPGSGRKTQPGNWGAIIRTPDGQPDPKRRMIETSVPASSLEADGIASAIAVALWRERWLK